MVISEVMTPNPTTMDWQETVGTVRNAQFPAYIVEKNGLYYGIITKADINKANADDADIIDNYVVKTALTTEADIDVETLRDMINRAQRELNIRLRFVPVLDNGKAIGIVTTNDMYSRYREPSHIRCDRCGLETDDLTQVESGALVCPECAQTLGEVFELSL